MLHLSSPLPASLTDDLRVGTTALLHLDEAFKSMAADVRVWTFYETADSRLSAGADVYLTAPLTSIKSAILGMRQERIFPLQSDHARMASFGRQNVHTMRIFLRQLAGQVDAAADAGAGEGGRSASLGLEHKVSVEVHGFFEDAVAPDSVVTTIRAWSTRLPLHEFLEKGPDRCISERLNEVDAPPEESRFLRARGRLPLIPLAPPVAGLGISSDEDMAAAASIAVIPPASPVLRPVNAKTEARAESAPAATAPPPATSPMPLSPPSRFSTPLIRPSPLLRAEFEQDLAIDRLSPPLGPRIRRAFSRSFSLGSSDDASRYEYRDFPPFSQRSRSDAGVTDEDDADVEPSPLLPEAVVSIRKVIKDGTRRPSETVVLEEDVPVAFMKPKMSTRRFVWMHVPFNNPTWVKVRDTPGRCY